MSQKGEVRAEKLHALKKSAEKIVNKKVKYIDHPSFHQKKESDILSPDPASPIQPSQTLTGGLKTDEVEAESQQAGLSYRRDLPGFIEGMPLLSAQEEIRLALEMNYCLYRCDAIQHKLNKRLKDKPRKWKRIRRLVNAFLHWESRAATAQNCMVMSNEQLLISVFKKFRKQLIDLNIDAGDALNTARVQMIRGVRGFDVSKGCKLSTYLFPGLGQAFTRLITLERNRRRQMVAVDPQEYFYENAPAVTNEESNFSRRIELEELAVIVRGYLSHLNQLQQQVIRMFFGLNGLLPTELTAIDVELGLSKGQSKRILVHALQIMNRRARKSSTNQTESVGKRAIWPSRKGRKEAKAKR
jgi:RNA polymerase sigma factor (sigma-70 family)